MGHLDAPKTLYFLKGLLYPTVPLLLQTLFSSLGVPHPFLSHLFRCVAGIFAVQAIVALPSVLFRSEKFYDLAGCAAFILVAGAKEGMAVGELMGGMGELMGGLRGGLGEGCKMGLRGVGRAVVDYEGWPVDWRRKVVHGVVVLWAVRLAVYTFITTLCRGRDSRFDGIRTNPKRFLAVFVAQGIWVTVCSLPIIAINCVPTEAYADIGLHGMNLFLNSGPWELFWFWLGMWSFVRGLAIECLADYQMTKWRVDKWRKKHDEVYCSRGLWTLTRHPNYYGECLIWLGIAMCCSSILLSPAAQEATGLSFFSALTVCGITPWFVFKMLRHVSIPIVERKYDKLYMHRRDYRRWRRSLTFRIWVE